MILTSDLQWIKAADINNGDQIIGFDEYAPDGGKSRRAFRNSVVLAKEIILKPCYKITMSNGDELISSEDHLWLVDVGNISEGGGKLAWKRTDQLRGTNKTRSLRFTPHKLVKPFDVTKQSESYNAGYLSGIFDGEGYLQTTDRKDHKGYNFRLGFSQRKNEGLDYALKCLTDFGIKYKMHKNTGGTNKDVFTVNIVGRRKEVFKFLSIIRPKRLISKLDPDRLGVFEKNNVVEIVSIEYIGEQQVVAMSTSTRTFIANGYASHNCAPTGMHDDCVNALALARKNHKAAAQNSSGPSVW